jgi:hypothetical protein
MNLLERWRRWRRWRELRWRRWYGGEFGGVRYVIDRLHADNRRRHWRSALKRDGAAQAHGAAAEVIPFPRDRRGA